MPPRPPNGRYTERPMTAGDWALVAVVLLVVTLPALMFSVFLYALAF